MDDRGTKTAVGVVSTIVIGAATAGTAFIFAPAIAVALVGGTFTGLYGAALTSASLALLGGGAVAAGGLGMAGGALVIAGGGAVVGLSASGAASALLLLSSPEYIKKEYSKLLANCEYIMLGKYNMRSEVEEITRIIQRDYDDYGTRLMILQEKIDNELTGDALKQGKEMVKSINESRRIMGKAIDALEKLLSNH